MAITTVKLLKNVSAEGVFEVLPSNIGYVPSGLLWLVIDAVADISHCFYCCVSNMDKHTNIQEMLEIRGGTQSYSLVQSKIVLA